MDNPAAIILSAGLSSRMGDFKPLLPLGGMTVLSRCIQLFKGCGIKRIVVVTGNRADAVACEATRLGATAVYNENFTDGMFSSVVTGIRALDVSDQAFFMLPVDIPLVRPETLVRLLTSYLQSRPAVLYPRFESERGHPPIIGRSVIPDIVAHDGTGGLRRVLEAWEDRAVDIDVADFGTIHDLDHPEDYVLAQGHVGRGYPNERECQQLFFLHETLQHVIEHSHAVAQVALGMCALLNCRPDVTPLDAELVLGAALTHDIGKGTRRHEQAGAEILRSHGFHVAAEIAEEHFDLTLPSDMPVSEKAVVFLADKLVQGRSAVPMEQRFLTKVALYEHEVGARQAILGRLKRAQGVYQRLEREMGVSPEQVACEALS